MTNKHVILVVFPAQGHLSPALQLAKEIIDEGIDITFMTSSSANAQLSKPRGCFGLNFVQFDDGNLHEGNGKGYMFELRKHGAQALTQCIRSCREKGRPITRIVYTTLLPWVAIVAREFHIPSVLLWTQPATTLGLFYYYFNGYEAEIKRICNDPNSTIQLPRLPFMSSQDLHSFMLPSNPFKGAINTFEEHFGALDKEENPTVLVNTFDELEKDSLQAIEKYKILGIGPLLPKRALGIEDENDNSPGADLLQKSVDCLGWLNSKPHSSVVYVSFGSHVKPDSAQMEEIAQGLLASGKLFLWVIRENKEQEEGIDEKLEMMQNLKGKGMIVSWCDQLEVLNHPSIGCFLTHCGWNSTLESILCAVPLIGFPKLFDQGTIAKLIVDVWKVGVRVKANGDGMVTREEIKKCIDSVMDIEETGEGFKGNARRLMTLGKKAILGDGSSRKNFKGFVADMKNDFYDRN